jgi:transposase
VIKFLNAENVRLAENYQQICEAYGENALNDGMVKRWCKMFREGRTNVRDDGRSGRPSLVIARLLDQVNEKIQENKIHLFLHLKRFLSAERFSSYDEVRTALQHWVKMLAADFFDEGVQKLVPRYDMSQFGWRLC